MARSVHTVDQENVSATLTVAVPAARGLRPRAGVNDGTRFLREGY